MSFGFILSQSGLTYGALFGIKSSSEMFFASIGFVYGLMGLGSVFGFIISSFGGSILTTIYEPMSFVSSIISVQFKGDFWSSR